MQKDDEQKLQKIDKKINKLESKRYPAWFYESYVEYRLKKLLNKKTEIKNERVK